MILATVVVGLLAGSQSAQGTNHTTDTRCKEPSDGENATKCIASTSYNDADDDGVPNGNWKAAAEFGDGQYKLYVENNLQKNRIKTKHSPGKGDAGILRTFPVRKKGEVYQACGLAKVYGQTELGDTEGQDFWARLTVAQRKGNKQVGSTAYPHGEHNARILNQHEKFYEIRTKPFKMDNANANNVAVKFRAHVENKGAGGVAVLHSLKFLRLPNGYSGDPINCYEQQLAPSHDSEP
jgi:hypothetical protein